MAVGFTVIVNVFAGPEQGTEPLVKVGVTVIVAVTGDDPVLTAVNTAILPEPLANNPIEGVLFTQLYVVVPPVLPVLKVIAVVLPPLQTV